MSADHPRRDPDLFDDVVNDLLAHFGQWRRFGGRYPGCDCSETCQCVGEVVVGARRLGFLIEGDRRRGYRLAGFRRVRYVRPTRVCEQPSGGAR
jgi:hypothetical protein